MVMVLPRKFHRIWNKRYWVHQNPKLQWPHCIYVLIRIRYAFINARFFLFTNAKGTIENQDTANMASAGRGPNCKAIRNYYQSTSSFAKSRFVNALQISEDLNQALLGYYRDSLIRIGYAFRRVFFTNAEDTIQNPGTRGPNTTWTPKIFLLQNHDLLTPRNFGRFDGHPGYIKTPKLQRPKCTIANQAPGDQMEKNADTNRNLSLGAHDFDIAIR